MYFEAVLRLDPQKTGALPLNIRAAFLSDSKPPIWGLHVAVGYHQLSGQISLTEPCPNKLNELGEFQPRG